MANLQSQTRRRPSWTERELIWRRTKLTLLEFQTELTIKVN